MDTFEILDILADLEEIGAAETPLKRKILIYSEIQETLRGKCHLGGSIGLMLHGIDLGRDFFSSDLDITTFSPSGGVFPLKGNIDLKKGQLVQTENCQSSTDMDGSCYFTDVERLNEPDSVKVEFKYDKSQDFDVITYEGLSLNVTKPHIILGWKVLFASRGSQKNREDLDKLGVRYIKRGQCVLLCTPFKRYPAWSSLEGALRKRDLNGKNLQISPP